MRGAASAGERRLNAAFGGGASARGVQAVPHDAGPGDAACGWRCFSDPAAQRAVVISPRGEYCCSRGKGLSPLVATQPGS